jgi:hypothetical protein|tara:strand:- start:180 stop:665 length:486 start_codon:yes stop_codon:yes gene_type:complete
VETQNQPQERLEHVDSVLDEYEGSLGMSQYTSEFHDPSVKNYMSMPRQQMEKLTVEECAEAALLLGGFSFYLQRSYNREVARVNWANSCIKNMLAGRESQYSGSWDSQYNQAIKEDGYASKLKKIQVYAQQRADRLTYLANSVKNISDLFVNLQRAKVNRT